MTLQEMLRKLGACREAREWAAQFATLAEAWQACQRGDWMAWFAARKAGEPGWPTHREVVLATCACAEEALPLCRPENQKIARNALAVTRRWTRGKATAAEVRAVADATYAVHAYDDAVYAVYCATRYAADAAAYPAAHAAAYPSYAAATAATAAVGHAADAARLNDASARGDFRTMFRAANAARDASLATSADICRRMLKILVEVRSGPSCPKPQSSSPVV